ncbi:Dam family site-specific DNA-(adenine-N6)-methyltransferase [Gallaecimonas kandeliae]|uniref:Dam family site-specific DNA-(adenine-N6)-methyltransferase n=1 Tax=Gallaecimonas kandeliae TaxID=3029055 RepID=UPI002649531E|nr:Dam family site-specific DNA-(adenine-N6)-methyltransferase [Gallaecimonas kandeliae]WKE65279.1 Dam family site-specific DNA-(adenine-N6)-methyltransferase [Gallaecimonas kandeliae]
MKKHRAFLKWAGGKYTLVDHIRRHLPEGEVLVEPFVGAGSVFLNSDFDRYVLNDINPDLINLYRHLAEEPERFIRDAKALFGPGTNQKGAYYLFRQEFNDCTDSYRRSLLFLYLNRHGYNGLCRYNRKGGFNVPFGSYKAPYFPEDELGFFAEKAKKATFTCQHFVQPMEAAGAGQVVYCDPPYVPLSVTASFTTYASSGFSLDDQAALAKTALESSRRGVSVLISNHDTQHTRWLYRDAALNAVQVKRSISRNGAGRQKVGELLALYQGLSVQHPVDHQQQGDHEERYADHPGDYIAQG